MSDLKETLVNKTKFEFFASLAELINLSPIEISSHEETLTIMGDNGKLKIIFNNEERLIDYDSWVNLMGDPLYKEFNEDKIKINSKYNIHTNEEN